MEYKFTAAQLREAAGISNTLYDQWKARKIITSAYETQGSGKRQLYSWAEVFRVAIIAEIVALGVSVQKAADHTRALYGFKDTPAALLIRRFPLLGVDRFEDDVDHSVTVDEIVRLNEFPKKVEKLPAALIIHLDEIERRVKTSLGE